MRPAEICLHYVSPALYRETKQRRIADSYLWALRDNYSEIRAENDRFRELINALAAEEDTNG